MPDETSRTDRALATATAAGASSVNMWPGIHPDERGEQAGQPTLTDAIERALEVFISTESAAILRHDSALSPLIEATRTAVLGGGKRVRPTFAYWGWRAMVSPEESSTPVVPALAALELLHAFALVHDDIMDDSSVRRGQPTAHVSLAAEHRRQRLRGDPELFGTSVAILVGDLCLVWADRLLATSEVPGDRVFAARGVYDQMRVEAIAGQFLDVLGEASPTWSVERAQLVDGLKTASYTVTRPLLYGMALGGDVTGQQPLRECFRRYGAAIGEAYQLRDDVLSVLGRPEVTGKPAAEDLRHGRPTVLLELARERATPRQRGTLERRLARGARVNVAAVTELLRKIGAIDDVERMIKERVETALAALAAAPIEPDVRRALARLARAATARVA